MEVIRSSADFNLYRRRVEREVWLGSMFPRQVFKKGPAFTKFFDTAYMTSSEFFEMLRSLCDEFDEDGFTFGVVDPDPRRFATDHLGRFPVAKFSRNDPPSAFLDFVLYGDNDAISFQVFEIVILSDDGSFAAYGKRVDEYGAISTFENVELRRKKMPRSFDSDLLIGREKLFDCIKDFRNLRISRREFFDAWK